ncbi:hypothetical protein ACQP2P_31650 [Dactylosporangium sp. CA-139114]|uniref:hypothetical protein n=1 Tax=Dactylosporangium sp. CA-139114 TaxID=3239931 RepID=UPI003D96B8DA
MHKLRTLHLGQRDFLWRAAVWYVPVVGAEPHRTVRVRVWGGGKNGRVLQAHLQPAEPDDSCFATPKDVRAIVEYALEHGWRPEARGGMFVVRGTLAPRGTPFPAEVVAAATEAVAAG